MPDTHVRGSILGTIRSRREFCNAAQPRELPLRMKVAIQDLLAWTTIRDTTLEPKRSWKAGLGIVAPSGRLVGRMYLKEVGRIGVGVVLRLRHILRSIVAITILGSSSIRAIRVSLVRPRRLRHRRRCLRAHLRRPCRGLVGQRRHLLSPRLLVVRQVRLGVQARRTLVR